MKSLSRRTFLPSAVCSSALAAPEPKVPAKLKLPGFEDLPTRRGFKSAKALSAAISLQAAGRDLAVEHMGSLLNPHAPQRAPVEVDSGQGIILLCRMLFVAKPGAKFRRPALGLPHFVGGLEMHQCQLEPIEIVDGVPFVLVSGYSVGGYPEPSADYLEYCIKNSDWNRERFKPKTAAEMEKALDKLIGFLEHGGKLTDEHRQFLRKQLT